MSLFHCSQLDPASRNQGWWQNGFTYREKKLSYFGRIIYLPSTENPERVCECCEGTAEIPWCIWFIFQYGGARLTTSPSGSVSRLVFVARCYASATYARVCLSVCVSMCLSRACILSKRLNISSIFFHHSSLSIPNGMTIF